MADNYLGKCALCEHFDLYDKFNGKYRCTLRNHYFTVFESQCSKFKNAGPLAQRIEMVEKAREGKLR